MGIFDIFTQTPQTAAQPAQPATPPATPTQPGNLPAEPQVAGQQTPVTDANGVIPQQPAAPEPNTPDSPLDQFKGLWETDPNKPADPNATPVALDPAAVQKVVAKADFSSAITPENLAAIAEGGEAAQTAFANSLNAVAQQVLAQSTLVGNKLTEQAVTRALAAQEAKLPDMLRNQAVTNHLKDTNPLFSNPAVKPVIEATQAQLTQKFPNASPAEIATMAQDYIVAMGETFAPKPVVNNSSGADDVDWDAFMQAQ